MKNDFVTYKCDNEECEEEETMMNSLELPENWLKVRWKPPSDTFHFVPNQGLHFCSISCCVESMEGFSETLEKENFRSG